MSSEPISPEALAEFIHVNCTHEYGMKVINKLDTMLVQRDITIQTIYEVIEDLNRLQSMVNKVQIITFILDTALAIGSIASVFSATSAGYAGVVITGAHCVINNTTSNSKVKYIREAMIEDKRHRDELQTILRQQELELPFEAIEFKAETGKIHEIVAAISKYITGDNIDWIKHLENIGILGIIPTVNLAAQQDTTAQSDQSKCSLSDAFKAIMKAIKVMKGFSGKKLNKFFLTIETIISMLCNCSNVNSGCNPTAELLETRYVPELMNDAVMMQELLEKLWTMKN